jgi:uncharacterized coiled-coil protein SlyX
MKHNKFLKIALPVLLFATGAVAQDQHEPDHGQMQMNGMHGMMMSHMQGMSTGNAEAAKIVDQLQKNLAAMQADKKSGGLKAKLAEQETLLKDLQAKLAAQSNMMGMMNGMMPGCCENMPKK